MTKAKLFNLLIGKSIFETILVTTIAVGFYMTVFPPYFHGWGEATTSGIAGWAVDDNDPWRRVTVQLFIDGVFVASQTADLSRPDVSSAGWARDEWHGYAFALPKLSEGTHEAKVYALHESGGGTRQTLQQLGDPIAFAVNAEGTVMRFSRTPLADR